MIVLVKQEHQGLVQQQSNMTKIIFNYRCYKKQTINDFLIKKGFSPSNIFHLISSKNVYINKEKVLNKNQIVSFFNNVIVRLNDEINTLKSYEYNVDIAYEDEYILIVDKPYNLNIEPTIKDNEKSLANAITFYYQTKNIKSKIHLINRLDRLTSGLVIIAKNQYIHNLFKNVKITKKYIALLEGKIDKKGIIKVNIKKVDNQIKRVVSDEGKPCITKYKLIKYIDENSLVNIDLLTGRTHQIRLSFAHISHPLVADPIYGTNSKKDMFLRAYYISFIHPITKKKIKISKITKL